MNSTWSRAIGVWVSAAMLAGGVLAVVPLPATKPPVSRSSTNRVTSFAHDHPEFAVLRDGRTDAGQLRFPHALHMTQGVSPLKQEDRLLTCTDCHLPDSERRLMKPIRFDQHCAACHGLRTIDAADGNTKAVPTPHGSPEAILELIDMQLNQWIAQEKGIAPPPPPPTPAADGAAPAAATDAPKPAEEQPSSGGGRRGRPGAKAPPRKASLPDFESSEKLAAFFTERRAKVLSKLTGAAGTCSKCHSVAEGPPGGAFKVTDPAIPDQWFTRSVFDHGAHEMIRCDDCHSSSPNSHATSDINLPGIAKCRECHSPSGGAADRCVTCHVYHQKSDRPAEGWLTSQGLLNRQAPAPKP